MKTVKLLKNDTNQSIPAEVRKIENGSMVVLLKDFDSSKLQMIELTKSDDDTWTNGVYSCTFTSEDMGGGEKLVRVPKK